MSALRTMRTGMHAAMRTSSTSWTHATSWTFSKAPPTACILLDARLDYLGAAAPAGIIALLLDRKGAHRPESMPAYVNATLRNLAGLPHWVETWTSAGRS